MSIEAGNILRQSREQKGVSIKEASDALHIRIPYLQALESGRAEIIPSNVQARGFLRIYAEYLNLEAADIIQEWDHPGTSPLSNQSVSAPETPVVTPPVIQPAVPQAGQPVPPYNGVQNYPPAPGSYTVINSPIRQEKYTPNAGSYTEQSTPFSRENIPPAGQPLPFQPGQSPQINSGPQEGSSPAAEEMPKPEQPKKDRKKPKEKKSLFGRKPKPQEQEKDKDPEVRAQELFTDIGNQLSYRRKFLSLSLEDCEAQTLIRSIYIESMEDGKFEQLPSFIQARGMLNSYASFLDLDVEEIMLKLAEALQLLSQKKNRRTENKRKPVRTAGRLRKFFTPDLFVGVFVIVGIAGIIIYSAITIAAYRRNVAEPTPDLGISLLDQFLDTTRTPAFIPTESPTAEAGMTIQDMIVEMEETPEETSQLSVSSQPVQLFVTANQRTLMRVVSDGKEVFSGRTIPNNTYPFDAENLIELTVGNGDAVSVVYNQQNLGRLGKIGEVMTIDFSPYMAATPTPQFSPTPTNTYEPTYTPQPETPLPTNTPTPYIP